MDKNELKNFVYQIDDLPSLPSLAVRVIEVLEDPDTTATELAKIISADQGITLRILRMANSAYYGFSRQIGTVNLAIVVLGFDAVKSLTLSLSIKDTIKKWGADLNFDFKEYWIHSLYTAVGARMLAKNVSYKIPGEAFVAGLIHDMGKLVIAKYFKDKYEIICQIIEDEEKPGHVVEERVLEVNHGAIGGWLAEKWQLPDSITDTVTNHHSPANSSVDPHLTSIINLANSLTIFTQLNIHNSIGALGYNTDAWNTLKMRLTSEGELNTQFYVDMFNNEVEKSKSLLEVLK